MAVVIYGIKNCYQHVIQQFYGLMPSGPGALSNFFIAYSNSLPIMRGQDRFSMVKVTVGRFGL